jgi:hypothetical protein
MSWRRADGSAFDPWIRTHERIGGVLVKPAPQSMVIEGSVAEWESWTGMALPGTGDYVIPDALAPLTIDRERDRGRYVEPNVWMAHELAGVESLAAKWLFQDLPVLLQPALIVEWPRSMPGAPHLRPSRLPRLTPFLQRPIRCGLALPHHR